MLRTFREKTRPYAADALLVVVILLMTIKLTHGLAAVRDLGLHDETVYLVHGYTLPHCGLMPAQYSPLYTAWYFVLSLVQPDRIRLYFLNWSVLAFLLPAACYALTRRLGGTRVMALAAAFVLLTSDLIEVCPYAGHFSTALLAGATALAAGMRRQPWGLAVLGVALALAAYVRPEYAASFVLFCLAGLPAACWAAVMRPASRGAVLGSASLVGVTAAGLLWIFGNPLAGDRSFVAFSQHYAVNVAVAKDLKVNPWSNYVAIAAADFGDAQSFPQALCKNPRAVLWHVSRNAAAAPRTFVTMLVPVLNLSRRVWYVPGALVLAAALAGALGLGRRVFGQRLQGEEHRGLPMAVVMLGLVLAPCVSSVLLIYPRQHYLLPAAVFATALLAASPAWFPGAAALRGKLNSGPAVLLAAVLCLVLTPSRLLGPGVRALFPWNRPAPAAPSAQRAAIETLCRLHVTAPVASLECGYTSAFYAGMDGPTVVAWTKAEGFRQFITANGIGVIIVNEALTRDTRFRDDPEFRQFLERPEADGFTLFPVPNARDRIAVRSDLLPGARH
jgi:hypothetical protein